MKSFPRWSNAGEFVEKNKKLLITFAVGLAIGFGCGQMLDSNAQATEAAGAGGSKSSVAIPVHAGKKANRQTVTDMDSTINRLRTSASKLSLPNSLFDPWWRTMQHDPDAAWILRNFDVMSSDMDRAWPFPVGMGAYIPRLDTVEQDSELKITAEVPGIDEHNLEVTVTDDSVTIKGDKKDELAQASEKGMHSIERSYGQFERTLALPCKVQSEKAKAMLKNGVLTIVVPKSTIAHSQGKKLSINSQ